MPCHICASLLRFVRCRTESPATSQSPPATPLQPGDPGPPLPESALPSGPTRARPIPPSLRKRHEIIPSRAGDGRQSKTVFLHSPHTAKSRFMLRGSAARGWSRRRRLHDSPLANQATSIPHAAKPCTNTCPPGTAAACCVLLAAVCLTRLQGSVHCPPVHLSTAGRWEIEMARHTQRCPTRHVSNR